MNHSAVVELRRYTLRPGQRDTLVELFDANFVESQEAVGIDLIGQFRELDDPDVFTWIRGFRSMEERARGLADFYDGETWHAHSRAANATMVDSDDVLLLRPARPDSAFRLPARRDNGRASAGYVAAVISRRHICLRCAPLTRNFSPLTGIAADIADYEIDE